MVSLADKLVPDSIKQLEPYQSARRIARKNSVKGQVWLNANELESGCQYGDGTVLNSHYNRYPDFLPQDIEQAYAKYCAQMGWQLTDNTEVMAVRGADEAIDLMVRTFCQPGHDQIMVCPPTYGMYQFCADSFGVTTKVIPLLDNFQLDLKQVKPNLSASSIVFLCSPSNPTGNLLAQADLVELLEAAATHCLVVIDEAYIEFSPQASVAHLLTKYPHLVIIRTLSKAFGLAAIRVGYILADRSVMTYLQRLVAPYPISDPSAEVALKALTPNGVAKMVEQTASLIDTRDQFIQQLKQLVMVELVFTSTTNFVLVRFKGDEDFYSYLLNNGIVARSPTSEAGIKGCVRISIGSKKSMQQVIDVLAKYQKGI